MKNFPVHFSMKLNVICLLFVFVSFLSFANKKHVAIVNSNCHDKTLNKVLGDHYEDNVTTLLNACQNPHLNLTCQEVYMEDPAINWKSFDAMMLGSVSNTVGILPQAVQSRGHTMLEMMANGDVIQPAYQHIIPWMQQRQQEGAKLINGFNTTKLMLRKSDYLRKLQANGVPVIPTLYVTQEAVDGDLFDDAIQTVKVLNPSQAKLKDILDQSSAQTIQFQFAQKINGSQKYTVAKKTVNVERQGHDPYAAYQIVFDEIVETSDIVIQKFPPKASSLEEISFVYIKGSNKICLYTSKKARISDTG